jgi:hypothetical protein
VGAPLGKSRMLNLGSGDGVRELERWESMEIDGYIFISVLEYLMKFNKTSK